MSTKKIKETKKGREESSVVSQKYEKANLNNDTIKKVVVKRRKTELKPTKASAVAIASQANRARKQALIEKVANSEIVENKSGNGNNKVPLWVWVFFGCSLMLFCVSFYQAIIRPQLENGVVEDTTVNNVSSNDYDEYSRKEEPQLSFDSLENGREEVTVKNEVIQNPQNPEELIQAFFAYMSKGDFDESFNLFDDRTQNDKNIREHFTAFRMAPFFAGIKGNAVMPQNVHKISETYKGNEVYSFDISYILDSTQQQYDETWKFATSDKNGELKILMLYCVSSRCARHPIFGPEDFGLMR